MAARRLNYQEPAKSLLIQKGRGEISHDGSDPALAAVPRSMTLW